MHQGKKIQTKQTFMHFQVKLDGTKHGLKIAFYHVFINSLCLRVFVCSVEILKLI